MSPTATLATVTVARRFNGPLTSANGGYACGLLARHVDGPAEVTLRRPVPLDRELDLERHDDGRVTLHDGDTLLAEGEPAAAAGLRAALPALRRRGARGRALGLRRARRDVRGLLRLLGRRASTGSARTSARSPRTRR